MNDFSFLLYFVLFAGTAGATFAFMWKVMSSTLESVNKPPPPRRDTLHPEMRDIKNGEQLLVFRPDPDEDEDDEDEVFIIRK
tara:strand:- start:300 stop:545 length:246 start_codon:yes stop_codon:yes gene_type:complete